MKITWTTTCSVPAERLAQNEASARRLGFPRLGAAKAPRLAIVGGGPSIKDRVDEIRAFDGEVWAINGAFHWCVELGIDATFFSIDPKPKVADLASGAKRAILSLYADPCVFDRLSGAEIDAVKVGPGAIECGSTTATAGPAIAIRKGHREITFFGCEGSYTEFQHAYAGADQHGDLIRVRCDGSDFLTSPAMMIQAEMLAEMIRSAPSIFKDKSGGLLSAAIRDPQLDVTAASKAVHDAIGILAA